MKFLAAIAIAFVLLASPLICAALPCDFASPAHDCCPKSPVKIACPYDLLDRAKAVQAQLVAPVAILTAVASISAPAITAVDVPHVDLNFRNLHDRIGVLRL